MKAVIWTKYGKPDVLKLGNIDKPIIKDSEILVQVKATTVTMGDCEMRSLDLPLLFSIPLRFYLGFFKPKNSKTLGQEFAGVVAEIGRNVTRFKPGDEVFGQTSVEMGAYAQYMKLSEKSLITLKPKNISFQEAACTPLGGLESIYYINKANIKKGDRVLIVGAGGSIGTMGIQLLKMLGANVTGVDTGDKFEVMKNSGADIVIDFTKENYLESDLKYDAIFDVVGKNPLKKELRLLKSGGVYLHMNPKIRHMIFRSILGGADKKIIIKVEEQKPDDLDYLADLLRKEKIKSVIDKIMPLDRIAEAHEYVEEGKKKGNLVITVEHK